MNFSLGQSVFLAWVLLISSMGFSAPKAYVANNGSPYGVSVIDTATNAVIKTITVGNNPRYIAITPDGTKAYVANENSNSVSVINIATNDVITTIPVGNDPLLYFYYTRWEKGLCNK